MIVFGAVLPHPPILLSEIGQGRESAASSTLAAYKTIAERLRALEVERCVLISSHGIVTLNRFHLLSGELRGNFGPFGAEQLEFGRDADSELVDAILTNGRASAVPLSPVFTWEPGDHASGVPLLLLGSSVPERVAVVSMSFLDAEAHVSFGRAIGDAVAPLDGRTAVLASGDGVHTLSSESPYGFHPLAAEVQEQIELGLEGWDQSVLTGLDPEVRASVDESLVSPALILMGALHGLSCRPRILSSEAPWGVGYVCAAVETD